MRGVRLDLAGGWGKKGVKMRNRSRGRNRQGLTGVSALNGETAPLLGTQTHRCFYSSPYLLSTCFFFKFTLKLIWVNSNWMAMNDSKYQKIFPNYCSDIWPCNSGFLIQQCGFCLAHSGNAVLLKKLLQPLVSGCLHEKQKEAKQYHEFERNMMNANF